MPTKPTTVLTLSVLAHYNRSLRPASVGLKQLGIPSSATNTKLFSRASTSCESMPWQTRRGDVRSGRALYTMLPNTLKYCLIQEGNCAVGFKLGEEDYLQPLQAFGNAKMDWCSCSRKLSGLIKKIIIQSLTETIMQPRLSFCVKIWSAPVCWPKAPRALSSAICSRAILQLIIILISSYVGNDPVLLFV